MKHRAFTLLQTVFLLLFLGISAAVLLPVFSRARESCGPRNNCMSNLRQIGLGIIQYTHDYDEKYPILTTEQGWVGALQPYLKSTQIFACPQEKLRGNDNLTDYCFNRRLAGVESKEISAVSSTFMSGDGEPSDDPNISLQLMPPLWITREDSPARRHLEGSNFLYADGHVKWLKPESVSTRQFLVKP